MSVEFTSWSRRALAAGLIAAISAWPQAILAQSTAGTDGTQAKVATPQVEANQAALALFLSDDPAAFIPWECDLAALIASMTQAAEQGDAQQGTSILAFVAQSPSASLSEGGNIAAGETQTSAPVAGGTTATGAEVPKDNKAGGNLCNTSGAGGTAATGAEVPKDNKAGGNNLRNTSGADGSLGTGNAGGIPSRAVSPVG